VFSKDYDAPSYDRQRVEQMKLLWDTITALGFVVEARDPYKHNHLQTVAKLAAEIAMQIGLSQAEIEDIKQRAFLKAGLRFASPPR